MKVVQMWRDFNYPQKLIDCAKSVVKIVGKDNYEILCTNPEIPKTLGNVQWKNFDDEYQKAFSAQKIKIGGKHIAPQIILNLIYCVFIMPLVTMIFFISIWIFNFSIYQILLKKISLIFIEVIFVRLLLMEIQNGLSN
jgi:hypothetical protein